MNIDFSKFTLKCNNNDCEDNEDHVCCVVCKFYNECIKKNWICVNLENGSPENCKELYLKNEKV